VHIPTAVAAVHTLGKPDDAKLSRATVLCHRTSGRPAVRGLGRPRFENLVRFSQGVQRHESIGYRGRSLCMYTRHATREATSHRQDSEPSMNVWSPRCPTTF